MMMMSSDMGSVPGLKVPERNNPAQKILRRDATSDLHVRITQMSHLYNVRAVTRHFGHLVAFTFNILTFKNVSEPVLKLKETPHHQRHHSTEKFQLHLTMHQTIGLMDYYRAML